MACRLKAEAFEPYFEGQKRLLPKSSDLAFYNWHTQVDMHATDVRSEVDLRIRIRMPAYR